MASLQYEAKCDTISGHLCTAVLKMAGNFHLEPSVVMVMFYGQKTLHVEKVWGNIHD